MASPPVLFLLFLMLFAKEATTAEKIIRLGSSLTPKGKDSSWASSSGHFAFGFYQQGNNGFGVGIWLVTPPENTIVWTANRDSSPVSSNSSLDLTKDGRLLLRNGNEDQDLLISSSIASASMSDSGNFVLYDKNSGVIRQSFNHPTDTTLGGQNLTSGDKLVSSVSKLDHSSGRFFLSMQSNGNLVAYPVSSNADPGDAYWASRTTQLEGSQLSLSVEGFLCIKVYGRDLLCLTDSIPRNKSQNSTSSIYRATLDVDGNLRLYEHQFEGNTSSPVKMLWQALLDKCQIKGFCGLNSYCSNMSGNAVCECYPGFVPSKCSGNVSLDCVQNHSKDDCQSVEDPTMLYNVTQLDNMYWGNIPYSVIPVKMETCKKSCQQDCNCGAVLYSSGNCKKYGFPLVYSRRIQNSETVDVALLKMLRGFTPSQPSPTKAMFFVVDDNKTSLIMILAFTLGCISLFCLGFAVFIFFTYRRKVYRYTTLSASENLGFTEDCSLRSFSYDELVKSTGGFTEEVGRGSFGAVYKGTIGDGDSKRSVAVKRLEKIVEEGEREFRAEITAIARTHHRNLVKLIGFCIDRSRKLLVYEYVSNGSLANLIFNGEKHLSWGEKLKIAMDVARGVLYLHEECEVRIIHCNIKPRNILMDEAWIAKISDFGLARLLLKQDNSAGDDKASRYLAPEWQNDASVSVKTDIYIFGVVLLEILCGRSSIDMNVSSPEKILLSSWVYQCFAVGQLNRLVTNKDDVDWKILERMVKVWLWCVQDHPYLRPSMKNVILMLEGLKDISIPPSAALLVK